MAHAYADLSLHLEPDDLDLLSKSLGESSAEVVASPWTELVAAAPDASIAAAAKKCMARIAKRLGAPEVKAAPDTIRAIEALVHLCREAKRRKTR